jgi:hypothetical protein
VSGVGTTRLTFGKYKDHTLNAILAKDKGYLVWIMENFTFRPNQNWLKKEIATLLNIS